MNPDFYVNVAELMPEKLPRPTQKPLIDEDGSVIPIITVTCEGIEW